MTLLAHFWLYTLAAFGLAYGLGHSGLSLPLRTWAASRPNSHSAQWLLLFVECPACIGFHVGWSMAWLGITPQIPGLANQIALSMVLWAFATAAANLLLAKVAGLTGESSPWQSE